MKARKTLDFAATLLLIALAVSATVWGLWRNPAKTPPSMGQGRPPTVAPAGTATSAMVAALGTPFPTNIPMSPPNASAEETLAAPKTASAADTLSSPTATPSPKPTLSPDKLDNRFILVNQDEQMMRVFENGIEVKNIPVSTGRPVTNAFTPAWQGAVGDDWGSGAFRGTTLFSDYMWFLFPGPEGSILIHSVPYRNDNGNKNYDRLDALGEEPVSNGCIRISPEDAAWLKTWNPVGASIEITRWSGKISEPAE